MKSQHVPKLAAIFPSVLVALAHFILSVKTGPYANVVFQHWFDTGRPSSGAEDVVAWVNGFLSLPIPAVLFASHPIYPLTTGWWVATTANSIIWGLAIYAVYIVAGWLLNKTAFGRLLGVVR